MYINSLNKKLSEINKYSFKQRDEGYNNVKRKPLPKMSVLAALYLLAAPLLLNADTYDKQQEYNKESYNTSSERQKSSQTYEEKLQIEYEKKTFLEKIQYKWDNIPDYQKLITIFYSSLVLMLALNIFCSTEKNKHDDNKY